MNPRLARKEKSVEHSARRKAAKGTSVMVARIIELAVYRAQRSLAQQEIADPIDRRNERTRFHFWTGASGKRYVHSVYDLYECPPVPAANYVLVRRHANGRAEALSIGRVNDGAPSLNLAQIRQRGAELSADEVHVHLLADTPTDSKLIEVDLRSGQVGADVSRFAGSRPH